MTSLKQKLYEVIFEADTKTGKIFDLSLLIVILLSILFVMLESVPSIEREYHDFLKIAEWIITIIFSLEYVLRIWIVRHPARYIFSFYGIIDLQYTCLSVSTAPLPCLPRDETAAYLRTEKVPAASVETFRTSQKYSS